MKWNKYLKCHCNMDSHCALYLTKKLKLKWFIILKPLCQQALMLEKQCSAPLYKLQTNLIPTFHYLNSYGTCVEEVGLNLSDPFLIRDSVWRMWLADSVCTKVTLFSGWSHMMTDDRARLRYKALIRPGSGPPHWQRWDFVRRIKALQLLQDNLASSLFLSQKPSVVLSPSQCLLPKNPTDSKSSPRQLAG